MTSIKTICTRKRKFRRNYVNEIPFNIPFSCNRIMSEINKNPMKKEKGKYFNSRLFNKCYVYPQSPKWIFQFTENFLWLLSYTWLAWCVTDIMRIKVLMFFLMFTLEIRAGVSNEKEKGKLFFVHSFALMFFLLRFLLTWPIRIRRKWKCWYSFWCNMYYHDN